jgi:hypothetical protein
MSGFYPEDGGSNFLRNVGNDVLYYAVLHLRRLIFVVTTVKGSTSHSNITGRQSDDPRSVPGRRRDMAISYIARKFTPYRIKRLQRVAEYALISSVAV